MKKFLKTVLIYVLIVAGIICVANATYRSTDGTEKFANVPYGIELCNFGSSHGEDAYCYDELDATCFNFALSAQMLSYDLRLLEYYRDRLGDGAQVIITVSHFSFFGESETKQPNFLSKNRRYYSFLPDKYIKEYDGKTAFYVRFFPALLIDVPSYITTLINDVGELDPGIHDGENESQRREHALQNGYSHYQGEIADRLNDDGSRHLNETELAALYAIIDICREENATPIMITTPFLKEYNDTVAENDPAFYKDFYGVINEISDRTGAPYYDYSRDERFSWDYSLFSDTTHLNRDGGLKFTKIVTEEVLGW